MTVVMAVSLQPSRSRHEWQKRQHPLIICQADHDERVRTVAVVVQDGVEPFGLGAMCEVWAEPYHPRTTTRSSTSTS